MNKYVYFFLGLLFAFQAAAQQDTSAFSAQRKKVNTMLAERSAKFGQYDESLNQRSGIFGWQTKKDIKNSNEILRQVVLTDNNIFKELKVLMEYKDLQNQQKVEVADHSQERIESYMRNIKKLQDENEVLRTKAKSAGTSPANYIIVFLLLVMAGGFYFFNRKLKATK